jgi:hypothetical protein
MPNQLVFSAADHRRILDYLLQRVPGRKHQIEQVAFVFARASRSADDVTFTAGDIYLVPPADLDHQSGFHISLTDDALGRVIKMAWDRRAALVELHSHPSPDHPAAFSPSDLSGLEELVPHAWWRLKGQPYLALVVAPSGFDALVWRTDAQSPEALAVLRAGSSIYQPTGLTLPRLRSDREQSPVR